MLRPSGILYVERRADPGAPLRADIYIADSAAQGVRVLQLLRDPTNTQQPDDQWFVVGPVAFFPLVIPTDGFPTRLAISNDNTQLFVLAPTSQTLHVLDVRETPFRGSSLDTPSNVPVAQISLQTVLDRIAFPAMGPNAIPVALGALKSSAQDATIVIVVYDVLDAGAPGRIAALRVPTTVHGVVATTSISQDLGETGRAPGNVTVIATATIARAPRELIVRDDAIIISSSATSSISVVYTSTLAGHRFLSVSALDMSGPTSSLIDAKKTGVVALRLDRTSAMLIEQRNGRYARSTRMIQSPYTPYFERNDPKKAGRIDLLESVVGGGAYLRVPKLLDQFDILPSAAAFQLNQESDRTLGGPGPCMTTQTSSCADVVGLAHVNGRMSFLVGNPTGGLRPALCVGQSDSSGSLHCTGPTNTSSFSVGRTVILEHDDLVIDQCKGPFAAPACDDAGALLPRPACTPTVAPMATEPQLLRAIYRGTLVTSRAGLLTRTSTVDLFELTDSSIASFSDRQVKVGDQVDFVLETSDCGGGNFLAASATIAAVPPDRPQTLDLRAGEIFSSCLTGQVHPLTIYQASARSDVVLTRVHGATIDEVITRSSTKTFGHTGTGMKAEITGRVRITLTSSAGFACRLEVSSRTCFVDADCDPGATCSFRVQGCRGVCNTSLSPELVHHCSGVEVGIVPLSPGTLAANVGGLTSQGSFFHAVPDQVISVPIRQSFMTSYPGSRTLVETKVDPLNGVLPYPIK